MATSRDSDLGPRAPRRRLARSVLLASAAALLAASASAAAPPSPLAAPTPAAPAAPDPRRGEALYVGSARLSAGGAPCLGCHGIAGHGLARAASFGPDLSGAHAQYGADGLDGLLEEVVFPSMAPIYRNHAVTKDERADLVTFLGEAASAHPAALPGGFAGRFAVGVAAAAAAFLALVVAIGRRGRPRGRAAEGRTP